MQHPASDSPRSKASRVGATRAQTPAASATPPSTPSASRTARRSGAPRPPYSPAGGATRDDINGHGHGHGEFWRTAYTWWCKWWIAGGAAVLMVISVAALPAYAQAAPSQGTASTGFNAPASGTNTTNVATRGSDDQPENAGGTSPLPLMAPATERGAAPAGANPQSWSIPGLDDLRGHIFEGPLISILRRMNNFARDGIDDVARSRLNFVTQTPEQLSYGSRTVYALWQKMRLVANGALVLVVLFGGYNVIIREQIGSDYHEALELIPRVALGALLVNTSLRWGGQVIEANNALCQAIQEVTLPGWDGLNPHAQILSIQLATTVYLVTCFLLLLQMLMRLALIDVLLAVAPLAMLCWVLPQTQRWAQLWTTTFFSTVMVQFVQVLSLFLGASLMGELQFTPGEVSFVYLLLSVALIALTLKIPSLLHVYVGGNRSHAAYFALRQGTRSLFNNTAHPTASPVPTPAARGGAGGT